MRKKNVGMACVLGFTVQLSENENLNIPIMLPTVLYIQIFQCKTCYVPCSFMKKKKPKQYLPRHYIEFFCPVLALCHTTLHETVGSFRLDYKYEIEYGTTTFQF